MSRLILMRDPLRGGREFHELTEGANLADELRRLFPDGFPGHWYLYRSEALPENQIDWRLHPTTTVDKGLYLLIVRPRGGFDIVAFAWSLLVSAVISGITYLLTPRPRQTQADEERESPNNAVAGQSNTLRAGARVPDILGKVRAYPDLITNAVEQWFWPRTQSIVQFVVVGQGTYEFSERRLGDSRVENIAGVSWHDFLPGETVPVMRAIQAAPTVDNISLSAQAGGFSAINVTFDGDTKTVTSDERIPIELNRAYFITGTEFNTVDVWVVGVPAEAATAPFVYQLDGDIADEADVNAVFTPAAVHAHEGGVYEYNPTDWKTYPLGEPLEPLFGQIKVPWWSWEKPAPGDLVDIHVVPHPSNPPVTPARFLGRVRSFYQTSVHTAVEWIIEPEQMDGTDADFDSFGADFECHANTVSFYAGGAVRGSVRTPTLLVDELDFTSWYAAPMDDPDEIWIDIEFPSGLTHYSGGARIPLSVSINAEFREAANPGTVVTKTFTYTSAATYMHRATERVTLDELNMSGVIEVRLIRTTPIYEDSGTDQYLQDTRWRLLRSVKNLPERIYPDITITQLITFNSASASSVGETSYNVVATRVLPTWIDGEWSEPAATERWADNLVARMKASDGANKLDSEIDLAGIYAIQDYLDTQDGGEGGKISMTLDTIQDIDAELQQIAATARALVYRIGKKLYATRDQGGKTALALFTGRSKQAAGEQLQLAMQNDSEVDAVIVPWFDRRNGWKKREYQYPENDESFTAINPTRITPTQATWSQAWRRAVYEWNRLKFRRDTLSMQATEEARLLHLGDVINVTDDVANLATAAGEVIAVDGLTLTLDKPVDLSVGDWSILLRAADGRTIEVKAVTAGASETEVELESAPAFALKGRDDSLGSMYAIYSTTSATVRQWLVTGIEPGAQYTRILAQNWREEVFTGDDATPPPPPTWTVTVIELTAGTLTFSGATDIGFSTGWVGGAVDPDNYLGVPVRTIRDHNTGTPSTSNFEFSLVGEFLPNHFFALQINGREYRSDTATFSLSGGNSLWRWPTLAALVDAVVYDVQIY